MTVHSMQAYRDRKAPLSVEKSCAIFVGMTVLVLAGAVWAWWDWWLA